MLGRLGMAASVNGWPFNLLHRYRARARTQPENRADCRLQFVRPFSSPPAIAARSSSLFRDHCQLMLCACISLLSPVSRVKFSYEIPYGIYILLCIHSFPRAQIVLCCTQFFDRKERRQNLSIFFQMKK